MRHRHVPGWSICDLCRIHFPALCPTCAKVHVRLHHSSRQLRRAEKARKGAKR